MLKKKGIIFKNDPFLFFDTNIDIKIAKYRIGIERLLRRQM